MSRFVLPTINLHTYSVSLHKLKAGQGCCPDLSRPEM
nr:MAG TPA: hypothetical protein [Bacteriophage sp.]